MEVLSIVTKNKKKKKTLFFVVAMLFALVVVVCLEIGEHLIHRMNGLLLFLVARHICLLMIISDWWRIGARARERERGRERTISINKNDCFA